MQMTEDLIRNVVQEVLSHVRNGQARPSNGKARAWGIFNDVGAAVAAASEAQRQFGLRNYHRL